MPQKQTNCNLCSLTYSLAFKKREWKEYISGLPIKTEFYLKDKFIKKFIIKENLEFPAAFLLDNKELKEIIGSGKINKIKDLEELKSLVNQALSDFIKN